MKKGHSGTSAPPRSLAIVEPVVPFQNSGGFREVAAELIRHLDLILHRHWDLGKNVVVGWTPKGNGIEVLCVPNHKLSECLSDYEYLLMGPRMMSQERLDEVSRFFDKPPVRIPTPQSAVGQGIDFDAVERIISRYAIRKTRHRAAILFDIVNFSIYSPLQQVMQLNSLQHSIDAAQNRLIQHGISINLSRWSTGDGFYVWSRDIGLDEDADLFFLMILALADNAIARYKGKDGAVPLLRTCFNIGSHFEFFQSEALSPSGTSYIVGDLTIDLARMVEKALPGQILIGSFIRPVEGEASKLATSHTRINAPLFMALAQKHRDVLKDLMISDEQITEIKLYLTGTPQAEQGHNVKRYRIFDKHGKSHHVFNAKINLHRGESSPIFLGKMDSQLGDFDAEESVLDLSSSWAG